MNSIPIFQPDDGKGRGPSLGLVNMPFLKLKFNQEPSDLQINTLQAKLTIAKETKTYDLTETTADSGIFTSSDNSLTLSLQNPNTASLRGSVATEAISAFNPNLQDEITCSVTSSFGNLNNKLFNLKESASDSLYFNDVKTFVTVIFNSELLSYQNDILTIRYTNGLLASEETLTETSYDSLVFANSDNTFTITLNNYPGTMPDNIDITIENQDYLELLHPRLVLHRIKPDTYAYTNRPKGGSSDLPPNDPNVGGQGVFKIKVKGLPPNLPEAVLNDLNVTLDGGIQTRTLSLSKQDDGSYMTERLILLPESVFATYDNMISLNAVDSIDTWSVQLGQDIYLKERLKAKSALIASTLDEIKDYRYNYKITDVYHIFNDSLDYITGLDYNLTKQELTNELPKRSVIYISGHGVVLGKDKIFDAFAVWEDDDLQGWFYLKPHHIQAQGYKLVFLNGCRTADERTNIPEQFKAAFDSQVYIGWTTAVDEPFTSDVAEIFFKNLDGGNTVDKAMKNTKKKLSYAQPLKPLGDTSLIIDIVP